MNNPFSIENLAPTWAIADVAKASVLKGDTPGHEFHGNQYTEAAAGIAARAMNTHKSVIQGGDAGPASEHSNIAHEHRKLASAILDGMQTGKIPTTKWRMARKAITEHNVAAESHVRASAAAMKVAQESIKPPTGSTVSQNKMRNLSNASDIASQLAATDSISAWRETPDL